MTEHATIRIGARGSNLSLRQVELVAELLRAAHPTIEIEVVVISTKGDVVLDTPLPSLGGKGVFTQEIESTLLDGRIDLAVHSLKDLPTLETAGIIIGAIPERASPSDALIGRGGAGLADLPHDATIGTSSPRRAAQLRRFRASFEPRSIRGNVQTRLQKCDDPLNGYDAIVLAEAGLARLGLSERISEVLPFDVMLPAPGQGALAIQCRDDAQIRRYLARVNHVESAMAVVAERAFLEGLGGGCSAPIAAGANVADGALTISGRVLTLDGSRSIDVNTKILCGSVAEAREIGLGLAQSALDQGAAALLEARA